MSSRILEILDSKLRVNYNVFHCSNHCQEKVAILDNSLELSEKMSIHFLSTKMNLKKI